MVRNLKQAHYLFFLLAMIFGVWFIKITPPLWGPDESIHFFRSYQISTGKLSQEKIKIDGINTTGGYVPKSFYDLSALASEDIKDNIPTDSKQVDSIYSYTQIGKINVQKEGTIATSKGVSIYPEATYIAPATGIAITRLLHPATADLLFSARFATLLLYVCLIFYALYILRETAIKWIVFVIALLPMSIFQASVVSADSLVLGLVLIFFSLEYRTFYLTKRVRKKDVALLAITGLCFTIIKPPYVVLALTLCAMPTKIKTSSQYKLLIRWGIPALCLIIATVFLASVKGFMGQPLPYTSFSGQLHWILHHPWSYTYTIVNSINIVDWLPQIIGIFGASFVFAPGPVIQLLIALLALTTFVQTYDNKEKQDITGGAVFLIAGLATSIGIMTTFFLTWTPVGNNLIQGVQGRYFLPVIIFVLIGFRMMVKTRLQISAKKASLFYPAMMAFSLLVSILWYHKFIY